MDYKSIPYILIGAGIFYILIAIFMFWFLSEKEKPQHNSPDIYLDGTEQYIEGSAVIEGDTTKLKEMMNNQIELKPNLPNGGYQTEGNWAGNAQ